MIYEMKLKALNIKERKFHKESLIKQIQRKWKHGIYSCLF